MKISAGFCLLLAFLLLVIPFRWLCAILIAAFFHELCHYIAIRSLSCKRSSVRLFSYSARMDLPEMSRGAELLSALAGPAGGFMLFALHPVLPRLATAGLVQSVYNLLPVYPLDGGRIFRCILEMTLLPPKAQKLQKIVTILCCIGILTAGFYGWFAMQYGPLCFLLSVLTVIRIK